VNRRPVDTRLVIRRPTNRRMTCSKQKIIIIMITIAGRGPCTAPPSSLSDPTPIFTVITDGQDSRPYIHRLCIIPYIFHFLLLPDIHHLAMVWQCALRRAYMPLGSVQVSTVTWLGRTEVDWLVCQFSRWDVMVELLSLCYD
jgi:hypothetical protein